MTPFVLWIPAYQYTSIPATAVAHATLVLMTAPLDVDAPSSRWNWASRRHVDHFWPSRPGVTPGPQDHSYTRVWCNTRSLGPLSARVWCNTRPPGPPLPPSGELVFQLYPVGNSLELCRETPGPLSWCHTRTLGPPSWVLLGTLPTFVASLGETRPLGFLIPHDFSEKP